MSLVLGLLALPLAQPPKTVAVVGGGLAGLATAHALLQQDNKLAIHILDPTPPGDGGASAAAAGLLHPYARTGRELWRGVEGYDAARRLLALAQPYAHDGERLASSRGMLRLAMSDEQATCLSSSAAAWADGGSGEEALQQQWVALADVSRLAAAGRAPMGDDVCGALFAECALSVDTPAYLRALWRACSAGGRARWLHKRVVSLSELEADRYDAVVVCAGAASTQIRELAQLPLKPCRGQSLVLRNEGALLRPLIAGKYAVPLGSPPTPDGAPPQVLVGASFEYDGERCHRPPDVPAAEALLRPALAAMHPSFASAPVEAVRAGVRALPPRTHHGYVPLVGRLPAEVLGTRSATSVWLLSGLGSRGLVHHALLGTLLAEAMLADDTELLPIETRRVSL